MDWGEMMLAAPSIPIGLEGEAELVQFLGLVVEALERLSLVQPLKDLTQVISNIQKLERSPITKRINPRLIPVTQIPGSLK